MFATSLKQVVKRTLMPRGSKFRKVLFGPAAGCVMSIDFQHHLRFYVGAYEGELLAHLKALIKPGAKCFDVGGQGGYDALIMARTSGGAVVSFECEATTAEGLRATFAHNPSHSMRVVETYVGAIDDDRHMTLDTAARQFFVPDFIKIDIEGAEDDALSGAAEVLSNRKPSLIIEVHSLDKENRCLEIVRSRGYSPTIVDQRRWLKDHRILRHNRWLVCPGNDPKN